MVEGSIRYTTEVFIFEDTLMPSTRGKVFIGLRSGGVITIDPFLRLFDFSQVQPEDVAYGLAGINRFSNQLVRPVTVAEHSVNGSYLFDSWDQKWQFLFHDAAEGLGTGDVNGPLKRWVPDYIDLQRRIDIAIFDRFGVKHSQGETDAKIHLADKAIGATEYQNFHPAQKALKAAGYIPDPVDEVATWPNWMQTARLIGRNPGPSDPADLWLERYKELCLEKRDIETVQTIVEQIVRTRGSSNRSALEEDVCRTEALPQSVVHDAVQGLIDSGKIQSVKVGWQGEDRPKREYLEVV